MKYLLFIVVCILVIILVILYLSEFIYDIVTGIYYVCIRVAALFNKKAKLWVQGRKNIFTQIEKNFNYPGSKKVWVHCASLGEFEQGRTVMQQIKKEFPDVKILLTFFSPSGYEVRKNFEGADYVCYLPFDSRKNAGKFLSIVQPHVAVFVKYEFWLHYIKTLNKKNIPVYLISSVFRKKQIFFRWYGKLFRNLLKKYKTIFVQNTDSLELLNKKKIKNTEIAFDTRFDRVTEIAMQSPEILFIKEFTRDFNVFVAGSTWPADEKIIASAFYHSLVYENFKLIIAPHHINNKSLLKTNKLFKQFSMKYSDIEKVTQEDIRGKRILIIDNIGMLASLYRYADICYIGGGFNKGIHNILEASVYGKPVLFGPKHKKFNESKDLIELGSAFEIRVSEDILKNINFLNQFDFMYRGSCNSAKEYAEKHCGGTEKIMQSLRIVLS